MGNSKSQTQTRYNTENNRYVQDKILYAGANTYDRSDRRLPPGKNDNLSKYPYASYGIVASCSCGVETKQQTPTNFEKKAQSDLHIISAKTQVQPKVGLVSSTNPVQVHPFKKESDNEIRIQNNKSTSASIMEVSKFATKDDFMTSWFSWKLLFLEYMKSIDKSESNKENYWGIMLLNRMGPVGQTIHRTFTFDDDRMKGNIDILLKKFDFYCIFGDTIKQDNEKVDKYVNSLKVMALKHMSDIDEIIKEKILKEINNTKFTAKAESLISKFSFESDISSLTIKEITYIWMSYEKPAFKQNEEIDHFQVKNCNNCGNTHMKDKCPAYGKQCNECGIKNHFSSRCPAGYSNCLNCGESHFKRQCLAYGNRCKTCRKLNHFFWRCPCPKILNCNFCGLSHIPSKSVCPALNTVCAKCNQRGHFPSKCRKNDTRYGKNFRSTPRLNF